MKNILLGFFALGWIGINAQTIILDATFDTGMDGFTVVNQDNLTPNADVSEFSNAWIRLADPDNTSDTIVGSTSYFEPTGTSDRWLISPQITLGNFGNSLSWEGKSHDASFPDDYYVLISTTDNNPSSFTDTVGFIMEEEDTWISRTIDLSANGLDGQSIYIAFVNRTNNGFKLYINDIQVSKDDPAIITENALNFSISPNPVKNNLTIQSEIIEKMSILNSKGQKILESKLTSIDVSHLKSGIYFVEVSGENAVGRKKFIKL